MKILMLGWELPPHNSGGLGVACYHMAKALAGKGVDIDFVLPYTADHSSIDFMKIHGATPVSPLEKYGLGAYDSKYLVEAGAGVEEVADLKDMRGVQKRYVHYVEHMLKTYTPDVIHAHDWLTIEAGMRAKELTDAPLIVHVHATEFDRAGGNNGNPLVHEIEYNGLMMADRIFAVSHFTKNLIVQKYGIPADKIEVVHNAFDADSMSDHLYDNRTYAYIDFLKSQGHTVISTITRLTLQKGLAQLLEAFAKACSKNNTLVLLLAGDGEQRNELIELSAELGIADKVFITGFVRGKQWRDAYCVSDIFVMSSISEPFGLTALEAAHHDNALIITKQSGVSEVLDSIFQYDFWDTDKLADQMVGIAESTILEESLKQNVAREYARISWRDVAEKCYTQYGNMKQGVAL